MKKSCISSIIILLAGLCSGCDIKYMANQWKEFHAELDRNCPKFPKLKGHRFKHCLVNDEGSAAVVKKGIKKYAVINPQGQLSPYYDYISAMGTRPSNGKYYFAVYRGKQTGIMDSDYKMVLPLTENSGVYGTSFGFCAARTGICYDENGNIIKNRKFF